MRNQNKFENIKSDKYNLDFRPASYFEFEDPIKELLANMKGESRRKFLKIKLNETQLTNDPPEYLFREKLCDEERQFIGLLHRRLMGGEYLPDRQPDEVEIARIVLNSTTQDVLSLRAKQNIGFISYALVDEYEFEYSVEPALSETPLSFGELISLFTSVEDLTNGRYSIPAMFREYFEIDSSVTHQELERWSRFVSFDSEFYPELTSFYEDEAQEWMNDCLRQIES
jgi:hypothetical protein